MADHKKIRERLWMWGTIAVLTPLVIPLVFALMGEATADNDLYRSAGRVGHGVVTGTRAIEESYTGRQGRPRTRTHYFIDVSYDLNPTVRYADFVAGGEVLPPGSGSANRSTAAISSSSTQNDAHRAGQTVAVVVLPDDPFTPRLYTAVRDYANWPNYLLMLAAFIAAALSGWRAWVAWRELRAARVWPMGRS